MINKYCTMGNFRSISGVRTLQHHLNLRYRPILLLYITVISHSPVLVFVFVHLIFLNICELSFKRDFAHC